MPTSAMAFSSTKAAAPPSKRMVRATALDAVHEGFETKVLTALCAGVAPETSEAALRELATAGVEVAG